MSAFNFKSKEFFINLDPKDIPPKTHPDYLELRDWERKKCIEGVNINGVPIWGSLYYHLNHFKTDIEYQDNFGNSFSKIEVPTFRDNDWLIHEAYNSAYKDKEGLILGSGRQQGKTTTQVSLVTRQLLLFQNSEVLGLFLNKPDKQTFTKKLQIAIQNITDLLVVPNIDKDFNKEYIRFGLTQSDNEPFVYSKLYMYLTEGGINTEVGAGKTVDFYFIDEAAKGNVIETHEAILPAITGKFGLRCSPFFTATGGNVEKSKDFETIFKNPNSFKFKDFNKTGYFLGGWYRSDFKDKTNFVDFYNKKYNANIVSPELSSLNFYETNFDKANAELDKEELAAKQTSLLAHQKRKMYYPRTIQDMFMKTDSNMFAHLSTEFQKLLTYLEANESAQPKSIELYGSENSPVTFKFSDKPLLTDFPVPKEEQWSKDTGVALLDPPRVQVGTKLYVVGCDPFNNIKSSVEASLGSFYVMRRETSDFSDPFGGRIVAWYNGRKDITHFRKTLLQTMILYGGMEGCCTLLHEASDDSLTQWFNEKNLGYLLEDTYALSREINPNTQAANAKGMRPTVRNQEYYLNRLLDYCEEELPDGRLGLWRINDPFVVKQLMQFDGDLGVVDAIAGLGHTMMHFFKERRYKPQIVKGEKKKEKKKNIGNAFGFHNNSSNFGASSNSKSII